VSTSTTASTTGTAPTTTGSGAARERTDALTATIAGELQRRTAPALGGFNTTILGIELMRVLRNKRSIIFTLVMPPLFFVMFGTAASYKTESAGHGNVTAYILISMAAYGAMIAVTAGGAAVSIERAAGWSRQLRLTPLHPVSYISLKAIAAMASGLVSVVVTNLVGKMFGAEMPMGRWILAAALCWICSIVFAAFGLFMGYLLPSQNAMQILGPALAVMAFLGGLFVPLDSMGHVFATIAKLTPMYGVGEIAHAPLTGDLGIGAVANVLVWTVLFVAGAAWRFRRDTARV
jgi:ABC-2 type transport system permease protein